MSDPEGLTTEDFIDKVAWRLDRYLEAQIEQPPPELKEPDRRYRRNFKVDEEAIQKMLEKYDTDGSGKIDKAGLTSLLVKMGVAPEKGDKTSD